MDTANDVLREERAQSEKRLYNAASVYILDAPYAADRPYTYYLPPEIRGDVDRGRFVSLPFGRGNRQTAALVCGLSTLDDVSALKPVTSLIDAGGVRLNDELIELCLFMKEQTFCTVGEAVGAMIPSAALRGLCACVRLTGREIPALNGPAKELCGYIEDKSKKRPEEGVSVEKLEARFGEQTEQTLKALLRLGVIERFHRAADSTGMAFETVYFPSGGEHPLPKGKKQRAIYDAVSLSGELSSDELTKRFGLCAPQLRALVDAGQLCFRREEVYRRAYLKKNDAPDDNRLTPEQEAAKNRIVALCEAREPKAALLYGVTGSGKTRVMKAVIDRVLKLGRGVVVLVPEISLTPQTAGLFSSFYGDDVAIIHSGLSAGQRYDEWRRIRDGKARICIGTRSAVFAPFEDLGLIIIDEEQEHTYKSDMSPRYHARDVARFRCARQNAVMLLSSATPSVESFYKAREGVYTLCTLKERYGGAPLPKAILSDMRGGEGLVSPIGQVLGNELHKNLQNGEQSILFVGRRGYNNFATCTLCGQTLTCPHCSVSLTYHAFGRYRPEENTAEERARHGALVCHYCGYRTAVPTSCPACGSTLIQFLGSGTQQVESELERLFPGVSTLRLDADTTGSKDAFETKLEAFRRGDARVMLGTQMVTKGHDFPDVTLVGVTNADAGLYMDDFRAGEHIFSLITQVIGRAGRGNKPGRAIVQTYNPDHITLRLAAKQDYLAFFDNEIRYRRSLVFPPFCDILLFTLSSGEEKEARDAARSLGEKLAAVKQSERCANLPMSVYGPFEAPVYRLKDQYRMRFVIKTRNTKTLRAVVSQILLECAAEFKKRVTVSADLNPSSL